MTAQSKAVIKSYFETGDQPTQQQFADLVDSYADAGSTGITQLIGDVLASGSGTGVSAVIASAAVTTSKIEDRAVSLAKMGFGTQGQIIYYAASGVPTLLNVGASSQVLTVQAGLPVWASAATGGGGVIVQTVVVSIAEATGSTEIPFDDTTPLVSEGTQIGTKNVTIAAAANKVVIRGAIAGGNGTANGGIAVACFRDSLCLATRFIQPAAAGIVGATIAFSILDIPGSAGTYTYSFRAGRRPSVGSWFVGSEEANSGGNFGGTAENGVVIQEVTA